MPQRMNRFEAAEIIQSQKNSLFIVGETDQSPTLITQELSWARVEESELENQGGSGKKGLLYLPLSSHGKSHYVAQGYSS